MRYEVNTRGGHCQGFVTFLVVLLRPTESDYVKSNPIYTGTIWTTGKLRFFKAQCLD